MVEMNRNNKISGSPRRDFDPGVIIIFIFITILFVFSFFKSDYGQNFLKKTEIIDTRKN